MVGSCANEGLCDLLIWTNPLWPGLAWLVYCLLGGNPDTTFITTRYPTSAKEKMADVDKTVFNLAAHIVTRYMADKSYSDKLVLLCCRDKTYGLPNIIVVQVGKIPTYTISF